MDMKWELEFACGAQFSGQELFVGEWTCAGAKRPWWRELARYVELGLQREGVHLRTRGRERRVVDPTLATLNAEGDEFRMASPTEFPQRCTVVLLRGALAEELLPRLTRSFVPVSVRSARLHAALIRASEPVELQETAVALLAQVRADSLRTDEAPLTVSPARRRLAEEIQHLIATRYAERLTLEDIAFACGSSPFHVSRVFRLVTGGTLHRHLTRVRLRSALLRLPDAAGRLSDLALATGFSSHSHFTQAFRSEFGCAPSASLGAGRLRERPRRPSA